MEFCPECQSGLFPTEKENTLYLVCRTCEYSIINKDIIIKKKIYKTNNVQDYGSNKYLRYDVTYPRTQKVKCPNTECISNTDATIASDAIYFNDSKNLKVIYICTICNTEWKLS